MNLRVMEFPMFLSLPGSVCGGTTNADYHRHDGVVYDLQNDEAERKKTWAEICIIYYRLDFRVNAQCNNKTYSTSLK